MYILLFVIQFVNLFFSQNLYNSAFFNPTNCTVSNKSSLVTYVPPTCFDL